MNVLFFFAAAATSRQNEVELAYLWNKSTLEAKIIIVFLVVFSIFSWSIMVAKAVQMRRAKKLNRLFENEFRARAGEYCPCLSFGPRTLRRPRS